MYVLLGFLIVGRLILGTPRMIANAVGLWYDSEFTLGGKTVKRPERFNTKAHKAAFEDVGRYVTDALTRDVMLSYIDRDLKKGSFLRPEGVPMEVWHQVLQFFADEGLIQGRWELRLPPYDGKVHNDWSYQTPAWLADGTRIGLTEQTVIGGVVPDSAPFMPSLLTEEQKQGLIGTQYALTYTDCLDYSWHKEGQKYVQLADEHFGRVYVRDRKALSSEQTTDGAYKLAGILGTAAALQK